MIGLLPNLPANVAGFHATGEVTRDDYEKVVFPEVERHKKTPGDLNFVFFVDTPMKNFSAGAWIRDLWLGLKGFARWHKVAIVSNVERIRNFTDAVSPLFPGEYKGFPPDQLADAIRWASTKEQKLVTDATAPEHIEKLLPAQVKGTATTTTGQVVAATTEDAQIIFERASERLQDVNQWAETCGASSSFQLTDDQGAPLQGWANIEDFIRIDLPGPGGREGEGYDWVQVEKIEPSGEIFLVQVRPSRNPCIKNSTEIAHFLESSATRTFIIERKGVVVTASVYGRNEVPNSRKTASTIDKWRNAAVGSVGAMGLSKIQWRTLVEGLLKKE
jgi:SpoIIAA-like